MTLYLRFFHLEIHRFSFLAIETLVTMGTLLFFLLLPAKHLAFFPNRTFRRFAQKRVRACVIVFLLSIVGRLALLPLEPFRSPDIHDEFSYLLAGDTFAHGRVTNPTPPFWHHFEAFYVLLEPTFTSKYGAAQPVFTAIGQRWLGTPRAGILLGMALAAASLCWMLQAYLPPEWAFLGGLIAVVRISWFSYFGNSYWGGAIAMLGGCLLLGASTRMLRKPTPLNGLFMAAGLILLANSRPFEGLLLSLPICLYTAWRAPRRLSAMRAWLSFASLLLAGAAITAWYFHRVTGQFSFPWMVYWRQWSICPPFLFGKPNDSVHYQFADQLIYNRYYEMQPYLHSRTPVEFIAELIVKGLYQWLFFFFPALTLPLIGMVPTLRARRSRVLIGTLMFASVGWVSETWLQAHYVAVASGILYLVLLNGLRWMYLANRRSETGTKLLRGTLASVLVMLLVRLIVLPVNTFPPNWASQTAGIPGYDDINRILKSKGRGQLVIVRYRPNHFWGYSWITNGSDLSTQHIIWARDTEPLESNLPLLCLFQDRQAWLLIPPEEGFIPPPDRTAKWNSEAVNQFLHPYPQVESSACATMTRRSTSN
jgi:hypothetical protein